MFQAIKDVEEWRGQLSEFIRKSAVNKGEVVVQTYVTTCSIGKTFLSFSPFLPDTGGRYLYKGDFPSTCKFALQRSTFSFQSFLVFAASQI